MDFEKRVEFYANGEKLIGNWGIPDKIKSGYPLVILATGDGPNGSKGQTWKQIVPMLNACGIGTFLFDFAGLGYSQGDYKKLTLSSGCRDFRAVVEYVLKNGNHDKNRIGVFGASFGGNVALLESYKYPQIKAVALKSASTFLPEGYQIELGEEKMADWGENGYLEEVGHYYDIVVDSLFHNTYECAQKIKAPVRIVHGTADSAVPIRHARDLLKILNYGTIFEIEGADHWYANGTEWADMATNVVTFLQENL